MNTLRPAEETWVDPGINGQTSIHEDGTNLDGLYLVTDYYYYYCYYYLRGANLNASIPFF
jgi:hypothetical protein